MKGDGNMKRYYERPTQVRWFDTESNRWIGGIAYRNEIICGCCGSILELDGFEEDEVVELGKWWVNIDEEIRGEDYDYE